MPLTSTLNLGHDELVHDIKFDFFGKRLASCSSDQKIKVFDLINDKWTLHDSFKAHEASITSLDWAHPEYGQIIASTSLDKFIKIWEQSDQETQMGRRWTERARLQDSIHQITSISFAPRFHGLRIGSCSYDGRVRIYEALDPLNLTSWVLVDDIIITSLVKDYLSHYYSLSWCQTQTLPKMFAVSLGKENGVKIYKHDSKWSVLETLKGHGDAVFDVQWSPSLGKSYQLIATACKDDKIRIFKLNQKQKVDLVHEFLHQGVKSLEWNITGTILSSCGDDGKVMLWKGTASFNDEWKCINEIDVDNSSQQQETLQR